MKVSLIRISSQISLGSNTEGINSISSMFSRDPHTRYKSIACDYSLELTMN